jgi:hypothetical protein
MDWKFALGTLFAALGALFALMNRHPRVYKAITNVLTDIFGIVGMAGVGMYLGIKLATGFIRESMAKQFPEMTAATVESVLQTADKAESIFGWGTTFVWVLFAGHVVFGILALLAVNEEDKKAKG